jgi:hypothetical protein
MDLQGAARMQVRETAWVAMAQAFILCVVMPK